MINNLSSYTGSLPDYWDNDEDRVIDGGPIYVLSDLLKAVDNKIVVVNLRCRNALARLDLMKFEKQRDFIKLGLNTGTYDKSVWCKTGEFSNGAAACDVYTFDRLEWSEVLGKDIRWYYYLKLALSKSGKAVLLVSCHD